MRHADAMQSGGNAEFETERSIPCVDRRSSGGGPHANAAHDQPHLTEAKKHR